MFYSFQELCLCNFTFVRFYLICKSLNLSGLAKQMSIRHSSLLAARNHPRSIYLDSCQHRKTQQGKFAAWSNVAHSLCVSVFIYQVTPAKKEMYFWVQTCCTGVHLSDMHTQCAHYTAPLVKTNGLPSWFFLTKPTNSSEISYYTCYKHTYIFFHPLSYLNFSIPCMPSV